MDEANAPRYRVNLSESTKGIVSVDVTAEATDGATDVVAKARSLLREARAGLEEDGRLVTPVAPPPGVTGT